jgi:divalent metal cation (Fe/Co/Zn/Cd) transporter
LSSAYLHSQAPIDDGAHSLGDLVSDFVVFFTTRHSASPDDDHNCGHSRYETVAPLFPDVLLIAAGAGMLWRPVVRIIHFQTHRQFMSAR